MSDVEKIVAWLRVSATSMRDMPVAFVWKGSGGFWRNLGIWLHRKTIAQTYSFVAWAIERDAHLSVREHLLSKVGDGE